MRIPKRLRNKILQENRDSYAALLAIRDYDPSNPAYALNAVSNSKIAMDTQQTVEVQKEAEADAARDDAAEAEWEFHEMILGVKTQVKAQYGEDSNELQSLGLKKKSEYRSRRPHPPKNNNNPI